MQRILLLLVLILGPSWLSAQNAREEKEAIKQVIWEETDAYFSQDYQAWRKCWVHNESISWTAATRDGVTQYRGWNHLSRAFLEIMKGGPHKHQILFKQYNFDIHLYENGAFVTFEQNMGSRSQEMRVLEKINGKWKIVAAQVVYNVGW